MDWTHNTIWRDQLNPGEFVTVEYRGNRPLPVEIAGATYFHLHKFKAKQAGLREITGVQSAKYVEIDFSNISSFEGVSRLGRIKRLELSWCLKLNADRGLAEIGDSLEWLHIDTSRKFSPTTELFGLKNLKVLCLGGCAPLDNLDFLKNMPELLDFRFVDTNILNGDLTPLVQHPRLVNAGFLDKRHYSLKNSQVRLALAGKKDKVVEYAYKGQFQTYRYKGLGGGEIDA